ncbi:MAG TPA: YetF domain-containing protein [Luteimonas sp.]
MPDAFDLAMPWWEFVLRAVAVYVVLLLMLRVAGKRTVGQFTPFDMLVIVLLGTAVQNSLIGEDYSLLGGLILAGTLIACNWCVGYLTSRIPRLDRAIEGSPVMLARDGELYTAAMRAQNLSRLDIDEALREAGLDDIAHAALVTLEVDGAITVVPKDDKR